MVDQAGMQTRILVVDDDIGTREALEEILADDYDVTCVADGIQALATLGRFKFDIVLLDLAMPKMDGFQTLKRIKSAERHIEVIIISATDRAHEAISVIKSGAYDYITKPFDADDILNVIQRAVEKHALERQIHYLKSEVAAHSVHGRIISRSDRMREVFTLIDKVAQTSSNVLISGESGTGKELVARAIHNQGPRAAKPFVPINCAAISKDLIESEFFGHEKGAFTGAVHQSTGKFEFANSGTVFLDEISTMPLETQAKLLRFLQEREFSRIGGNQIIKTDVRIIAATNVGLESLVHQGMFRGDLLFRLNVIPIDLPPLRHRKEDIPLLAKYFIDRLNQQLNRRIEAVTPEAVQALQAYHWPGNIRELENLIERIVVLKSDGCFIEEKDLPIELLLTDDVPDSGKSADKGLSHARRTFERRYILRALKTSRWNQTQTARTLKIHRNTLIQKMKSLDIQAESERKSDQLS